MTSRPDVSPDAPLPGMVRVVVWVFICKRCEHLWLPRNKDRAPIVCPKCKSPYWDIERGTKAS